MDVSVIIVNWNSKQFLRACIESFEQHTAGVDYEIIVIDSGSFDGCDDMLRTAFPQVRFIQSEANVGFSRANNRASLSARGRYLLFLNPDTEMISAATNLMLQHLESCPNAGAVGCTLLNADDSIQTSCIQSFPTLVSQLLNSELLRRAFPTSALWGTSSLYSMSATPAKVDVISGACLMMRRGAFEEIGRFSEEYFMYAEDLDLCHKLRNAGYTNYYVPQARVRHFGGGCTDSAPSEFSGVMMRESIWCFLRKSRGALYGSAYRVSTLLSAVIRLCMLVPLYLLQGTFDRPSRHRRRYSIRKWQAILAWSLKIKRAPFPS